MAGALSYCGDPLSPPVVDLAGDIALEHPDSLALGATVFDPAFHVVLRSRVRSQACDHDVPQRPVGLAVPAAIEPVTRHLPRGGLERGDPHRWAQAASECSRSGLSPAATSSAAAVSIPTP